MNAVSTNVKKYVDPKIVASVAVGVGVFGAVTYMAVKSGIKPLRDAAKIAKGGK